MSSHCLFTKKHVSLAYEFEFVRVVLKAFKLGATEGSTVGEPPRFKVGYAS